MLQLFKKKETPPSFTFEELIVFINPFSADIKLLVPKASAFFVPILYDLMLGHSFLFNNSVKPFFSRSPKAAMLSPLSHLDHHLILLGAFDNGNLSIFEALFFLAGL